jgi:hypothetical protein
MEGVRDTFLRKIKLWVRDRDTKEMNSSKTLNFACHNRMAEYPETRC